MREFDSPITPERFGEVLAVFAARFAFPGGYGDFRRSASDVFSDTPNARMEFYCFALLPFDMVATADYGHYVSRFRPEMIRTAAQVVEVVMTDGGTFAFVRARKASRLFKKRVPRLIEKRLLSYAAVLSSGWNPRTIERLGFVAAARMGKAREPLVATLLGGRFALQFERVPGILATSASPRPALRRSRSRFWSRRRH